MGHIPSPLLPGPALGYFYLFLQECLSVIYAMFAQDCSASSQGSMSLRSHLWLIFFLSVIHRACQPFIVFIIIEKTLSLGPSGVLLLNNIAFNTYQPRSGCKLALRLKQTSISWPNSVKSAYMSIVRSICYGLLVRSVYFNWQRYALVFKSTLVIPNCNASYCPVLVNSCF